MTNDFHVYVIFDTLGTPRYVGMGRGRRADDHARRSHNRELDALIVAAGGELPVVKICEGLTIGAAEDTEKLLIQSIGRKEDGGP